MVVAALSEVRCGSDGLSVKTLDALPGASDSLARIGQRLREAELAIFLDYDGTLTPIVEDHTRAFLSEPMRETLRRLAQHHRVAVISGRDLPDCANWSGSRRSTTPAATASTSPGPAAGTSVRARASASSTTSTRPSAHCARDSPASKVIRSSARRFDVAVHYRRVPASRVAEVEPVVDRVLGTHPRLRKGHGKKVFEILPDVDWDKGRAVLWLLAAARARSARRGAGLHRRRPDRRGRVSRAGRRRPGRRGARRARAIRRADFALDDPQDVRAVPRIPERFRKETPMSDWELLYEGFDPAQQGLRETLCTLGNGYFATRGAAPDALAGEVHYPGTYLAGGYNRLTTEVAGRRDRERGPGQHSELARPRDSHRRRSLAGSGPGRVPRLSSEARPEARSAAAIVAAARSAGPRAELGGAAHRVDGQSAPRGARGPADAAGTGRAASAFARRSTAGSPIPACRAIAR